MKNKLFISVLLLTSLIFFTYVAFRAVKLRNLSKIERVRLTGGTEMEKYDRYVEASLDRWGHDAIATTDNKWFSPIKNRMSFVHQDGHNFTQKGSIPLTFAQMDSLTNIITDFFKAYIDGSFDAYLRFHQRSTYTLNFGNFTNDPVIMNWIKKTKREFTTDDQKLKSLWEYMTFDNAQRIWIVSQMKRDQAAGIAISANLASKYFDGLQKQFESNVVSGKLNEFMDYKILAISKEDYYVYVFKSTNTSLSLANFQNSLVPGTQMQGNDIFRYEHDPKSIVAAQGYCDYAAMTASVLVNSCDCYVPIVVSFYWSPSDNEWLPYTMGRYSMGNYFTLF